MQNEGELMKNAIITTKRLTLHAISDYDRDGMLKLLTNDEIRKTYMIPDFKSREEELKMFDSFKRLSQDESRFVYGIFLADEIIGFMNDVDKSETEIEVGYVIHPTHHNKGYMTEVLSAAIQELFKLGFYVVKAGAFEENPASMRVMEKSGMTKTTEEELIEYRGKNHHCVYYEIRRGQ